MSAPNTPDERQVADLERVRRQAIHALMDIGVMLTGSVAAVLWATQGYHREALIVALVSYWGCDWPERTDER